MSGSGYIGRFAPSPTGDLHFGSLVAAVGSYLQARSQAGKWLVRIEDLDRPRVVEGSEASILAELARFGMHPDGEIVRQSTRTGAYQAALDELLAAGRAFPCACTRSELPPGPYPGTCRDGLPAGREGRSIRLRVDRAEIDFEDRVCGRQAQALYRQSGDFVIKRADGFFAYQLAVVVDDAWQAVTEVVRGADLLSSTGRQIFLQQQLALPTPAYLHLPLVFDDEGKKLGKRFRSDPLGGQYPLEALGKALAHLGHSPPSHKTLEARWRWALEHWRPERIPAPPAGTGHGDATHNLK